tara:strand:+ start:240 stop:707 length:468 start_codon:yes stop_codon:yes gene_type:complete
MNTTVISYYVMHSLIEGNDGDCTLLVSAKQIADIYGVSVIHVRYDDEISGAPFMVKQVKKWTLLSASEEDFATYDASDASDASDDVIRRIDWTKEANTVTVRPLDIQAYKLFAAGYHLIAIGTELRISTKEADIAVTAGRAHVALSGRAVVYGDV